MPYLAGCITFDKHSHVVIAILSRKILLVRLNKFFVGMFLCTICTIALIFTEKKTLVRMNKVGNVHYLREKINFLLEMLNLHYIIRSIKTFNCTIINYRKKIGLFEQIY